MEWKSPKGVRQTYSRDWKYLRQKQNDEQEHNIQRRQETEIWAELPQAPCGRLESIPSDCVACDDRDQVREVGGNSSSSVQGRLVMGNTGIENGSVRCGDGGKGYY